MSITMGKRPCMSSFVFYDIDIVVIGGYFYNVMLST